MKCNVCIRVCILIYMCVCVYRALIASMIFVCGPWILSMASIPWKGQCRFWPGRRNQPVAMVSLGQVASLAGTSTREMVAQDSLDSIGSLMPAVCSPHVARSCFAAAVFMHYARSSASKIQKYQNDTGISSNLCRCFISAVFCSLIKCCMPWKGAITPVASCDVEGCQSSSACGLGSLCWHLRANMRE